MNFVADESVDRLIIKTIRNLGHEVISVAETEPGIDDAEVLRRATAAQAVLVTEDKDFGELVFRQRQSHLGIVLIRLAGSASQEKAEVTATAIRGHGYELPGCFTVIAKNSIRVRQHLK